MTRNGMRNYMKYALKLVVFTVLISGCAGEEPARSGAPSAVLSGAPAGPVLATVNGEELTAPLLEVFARGRGLDPTDPVQHRDALDQLVETVVLAQDARSTGLAAEPQVQAEVALAGLLQLAGRRLRALREDVEVGEGDLAAYYQAEVARAGDSELHLKHILFADEASALQAAGEALAGSADFDAIMAEYAAKGALQARDLGWANLGQLPEPLANAARQMGDGQTLAVPVQTRFGWHVLHRAGARPFQPPPLEEVREGARRQLVERAVADKVRALRDQASVVSPDAGAASAGAPPAG